MPIFIGLFVIFLLLFIVRLANANPFSEKREYALLLAGGQANQGTQKTTRQKWWDQRGAVEKLCRFPLHFAVTPLGRYSISLAQILFWSLIVAFAYVYVLVSRGEFLSITGQILTLLGISAGTALASKAAAMARAREIPGEYMKEITENRLPAFEIFSL